MNQISDCTIISVLRTKVAREIYSSELVYVQSLGVTIDVFLKPLRKAAEQVINLKPDLYTSNVYFFAEQAHHIACRYRIDIWQYGRNLRLSSTVSFQARCAYL